MVRQHIDVNCIYIYVTQVLLQSVHYIHIRLQLTYSMHTVYKIADLLKENRDFM